MPETFESQLAGWGAFTQLMEHAQNAQIDHQKAVLDLQARQQALANMQQQYQMDVARTQLAQSEVTPEALAARARINQANALLAEGAPKLQEAQVASQNMEMELRKQALEDARKGSAEHDQSLQLFNDPKTAMFIGEKIGAIDPNADQAQKDQLAPMIQNFVKGLALDRVGNIANLTADTTRIRGQMAMQDKALEASIGENLTGLLLRMKEAGMDAEASALAATGAGLAGPFKTLAQSIAGLPTPQDRAMKDLLALPDTASEQDLAAAYFAYKYPKEDPTKMNVPQPVIDSKGKITGLQTMVPTLAAQARYLRTQAKQRVSAGKPATATPVGAEPTVDFNAPSTTEQPGANLFKASLKKIEDASTFEGAIGSESVLATDVPRAKKSNIKIAVWQPTAFGGEQRGIYVRNKADRALVKPGDWYWDAELGAAVQAPGKVDTNVDQLLR